MGTLYTSIKDDLLAKIKDGTYVEGELIPSEVDLAKAYGVSRPTVRQALRILTNEGYLDRRKRRGTVVSNPNAGRTSVAAEFAEPTSATHGVRSFEDEISAQGRKVSTTIIMAKEDVANEEVAKGLGIEVGDPVYKLVRLRYVDDFPNVFMENYVPAKYYPGFLENVDFREKRMYARMREMGRPVKKLKRRIDVIKADSSISMILDLPIGDPCFLFHTRGQDAEGNIVEYSISTYSGAANSFEYSVAEPEKDW